MNRKSHTDIRRILLATVCAIFICAYTWATGPADATSWRHAISDSLEQTLTKTKEPAKRLNILYNLYDLSPNRGRGEVAERIYQQAVEMKDTIARFDALRMLTSSNLNNDSIIRIQLQRAELMPPSPEQKETVTFIRITQASNAAKKLTGQERLNKLHHLLMEFDKDQKVDLYRRIEMLATICVFLKERSNDELVMDYVKELEKLVDHLPESALSLRSILRTHAAVATTRSQMYEDAVRSEEAKIALINDLQKFHSTENRPYLNYDRYYYVSYMQMLMNYRALTPDQVEDFHQRILRIAERNEDVANDRQARGIDEAFYHMARGEYAIAARLLDKASKNPRNKPNEFLLLHNLVEAAEKTGDNALLLDAYRRYVPALRARQSSIDSDRILEYQILHDLNKLQTANADLSADKHISAINSRNIVITVVAIALAVVLILLIVTFVGYRRKRKAIAKADSILSQLTVERDLLKDAQSQLIEARDQARGAEQQKTDFINTISHEAAEPVNAILGYTQLIVDFVDDKRRVMMEKFLRIIELNAAVLKTLINDVLDVAEFENSQVVLKYRSVDIDGMAVMGAETFRPNLAEGVTLTIEPEEGTEPGTIISVDPVRAEQVIMNLISNAVKFTEKGTITVTYGLDSDKNIARFTVTDTGPGIPDGKEEKIFERFEKLGSYKSGIGLGLYICRVVAQMLGGEVRLDTTYRDGARFIFTLPVNPNIKNGIQTVST